MIQKNARKISSQEESEKSSRIYNNVINVAKNEEFTRMLKFVAKHGVGFKPTPYHEIRMKYLKQHVEKTNLMLEEYKLFWKKNDCIIIDRWMD